MYDAPVDEGGNQGKDIAVDLRHIMTKTVRQDAEVFELASESLVQQLMNGRNR